MCIVMSHSLSVDLELSDSVEKQQYFIWKVRFDVDARLVLFLLRV